MCLCSIYVHRMDSYLRFSAFCFVLHSVFLLFFYESWLFWEIPIHNSDLSIFVYYSHVLEYCLQVWKYSSIQSPSINQSILLSILYDITDNITRNPFSAQVNIWIPASLRFAQSMLYIYLKNYQISIKFMIWRHFCIMSCDRVVCYISITQKWICNKSQTQICF